MEKCFQPYGSASAPKIQHHSSNLDSVENSALTLKSHDAGSVSTRVPKLARESNQRQPQWHGLRGGSRGGASARGLRSTSKTSCGAEGSSCSSFHGGNDGGASALKKSARHSSLSRFWVSWCLRSRRKSRMRFSRHPQGLFWQQFERQFKDLLAAEIKEEIVAVLHFLPQKCWQERVAKEMAACLAPSIVDRDTLFFLSRKPQSFGLFLPLLVTECMYSLFFSVLPLDCLVVASVSTIKTVARHDSARGASKNK